VQAVVTPPLVLASTSPQRRAILSQLRIPFDAVAPEYAELPGTGPAERAAGKARSVDGGGRPVLGVDTEVLLDGALLGKPDGVDGAAEMLRSLSGRAHDVVSGLCLRTAEWEELHTEATVVTFRKLAPGDVSRYVAATEWEGRAGAYAIQGLGAGLVERIEGDFLNVVGLPAALLVRVLASRFPGTYGFG
jgi:septum formation protein